MTNNNDYNWEWLENHSKEITVAVTNKAMQSKRNGSLFINLLQIKSEQKSFILEHENGKVSYNLNTNGFRGDEFIKNHNKKHIIFLGCSETFGEAGELEESWSHMLYSKIAQENEVEGFYNLGSRGAGWFDIISFIPQYIENFGNPDLIFIMFPNMERYVNWIIEKDAQLIGMHRGYYEMSGFSDKDLNRIKLNKKDYLFKDKNKIEYMDDFAKMSLSIKLLETYCQQKNINFFWSTTLRPLRDMIDANFSSLFKNFVNIDDSQEKLYGMINSNNSLTLEKKDNMHFGTAYHTAWSNDLFKSFLERKTISNE